MGNETIGGYERDFDTPEALIVHIQTQFRDGGPYVFRGTNRQCDTVSFGLFGKRGHIFNDHRRLIAIEIRIVDDTSAYSPLARPTWIS